MSKTKGRPSKSVLITLSLDDDGDVAMTVAVKGGTVNIITPHDAIDECVSAFVEAAAQLGEARVTSIKAGKRS